MRAALAAVAIASSIAGSGVAQQPEPVLEAHAIPTERRAEVERWRAGLAAPARTVWDERTGRLLLVAPLETHGELLRLLSLPGGATSAPRTTITNEAPGRAPIAANESTASLRLTHLTPNELHERLEALARRPLPATWDASRTRLSFPLSLRDEGGVTLRVDAKSGVVELLGPASSTRAWADVISAVNASLEAAGDGGAGVQLLAAKDTGDGRVRRAVRALQVAAPQPATEAADTPVTEPAPAAAEAPRGAEAGEVLGPVQIEFVDGLDVIVLRGDQADVDRVTSLVEQIERLSAETVPTVEVRLLKHADSDSLARLLTGVYGKALGPRTGDLSITGLAKPNALLLVGRAENVKLALGLVDQLDQPIEPSATFTAITLKHASAVDAKTLVDQYFQQQQPQTNDGSASLLRSRALVVADYRSNTLFVSAAPRDLAEVQALLAKIDTARGEAIDEVRVFPLKHALAEQLAEVITGALNPASTGDGETAATPRTAGLSIQGDGVDKIESGVLIGARVAADTRANALVVTAPVESMQVLAELIAQLDRAPDAAAELKVFTVANGDAVALAEMLRSLFGEADDQEEGGYGSGGLAPLSFSVDERTNSILAAGSADDLAVVEAILLRLDDSEVRERQTSVYRLRNAKASDVALVLNQWLQTERDAEEAAEIAISPFEQIEREVVVVAEDVSNSLIVSATPRYEAEVRRIISELDERPPMVMIQVLIAEVALNDTDEFGVELGLQDSLLFDRSLLSEIQTVQTTTNTQQAGGATVSVQEQNVISSNLTPGFNFNNQSLGNNGSTRALSRAGNVGAQALSSFSLNRVNSELDFGGFVFSASSSNLSFLLRALQESRRLEVLSRPQIMTLDGQEGLVQVGARVPRITSTQLSQFGQTNGVEYEPVGIILRVTPRISPDGQVVMTVYAEKSEVGEEEDGIAISVSADGEVLRAPQIKATQAETTISATSGQTVVLSGLLTKRTFDIHRRVPLLADIPLLGSLFRYDGTEESRTELLIIMTPRVVTSQVDAEMIKQVESSRMSWVLGDVIEMHGPSGLRTRGSDWSDAPACFPGGVPAEVELAMPGGVAALPASNPHGGALKDQAPKRDDEVAAVSYGAPTDSQAAPRRLPHPAP
ncbi:MAG: secretin N-terminal domain-containing protein [Lacipirellulaceae bacterium]